MQKKPKQLWIKFFHPQDLGRLVLIHPHGYASAKTTKALAKTLRYLL
jgi:hypothetical protein